MRKKFAVRGKRSASYGVIIVEVEQSVIDLRGEREAVANAAWLKLLGKNNLGEDVDKKLSTRKEIQTLLLSRLERERPDVYEHFKTSITIHLMEILR